MKGDSIIVEAHHARAAESVHRLIRQRPLSGEERLVVSVAGESGAGKSEVAEALVSRFNEEGHQSTVLQQDDYFVYPPRSNDRARREDIGWVGPGEVRLDLMDEHLALFRARASFTKPLVRYLEDRIDQVEVDLTPFQIVVVEGTYVSLLKNIDVRVFIDRDYHASRAHREKRRRHQSELDPFIDQVLEIEHGVISAHRALADVIIHEDYSASLVPHQPDLPAAKDETP